MKPYYQDSYVAIYHGNCFDIMPQLSGFDAVITDPPYMFGAASVSGTANSKVSRFSDLLNQSFFYREIIEVSRRCLNRSSAIWMFINWRSLPVIMKAAVESGAHIESMLVWDKEWIGPGGSVGLRPSYEMAALIPFGDFALPNRGLPDIWRSKWSSIKPNGHPSEKPESLLSRMVQETPGIVLDPFLGSGTTLSAARKLGRKAVGIEAEERYCEIAAGRCAQCSIFDKTEDAPAGNQGAEPVQRLTAAGQNTGDALELDL